MHIRGLEPRPSSPPDLHLSERGCRSGGDDGLALRLYTPRNRHVRLSCTELHETANHERVDQNWILTISAKRPALWQMKIWQKVFFFLFNFDGLPHWFDWLTLKFWLKFFPYPNECVICQSAVPLNAIQLTRPMGFVTFSFTTVHRTKLTLALAWDDMHADWREKRCKVPCP